MKKPRIAATSPRMVELEGGKTYAWCACGGSADGTLCDGSHKGGPFSPWVFRAEADGTRALCRCKRTGTAPFCDGSHADIPNDDPKTIWYRVADADDMQDGEVRTVLAGSVSIALTRLQGRYGALANACPHQGGPLGEGTIECKEDGAACYLRCPWHGWDFDPLTGRSPGAFDDGVPTFPVEEREDGIYVQVEEGASPLPTVSDVMADTMARWGVTHVFGMVGHSNLGLADAIRRQTEIGALHYIGIRHEGAAAFAASGYAKLTGAPAACLTIAGPGATNLLTGLWDAKVDRAPVLALTGQVQTQVLGPGAFQEIDLASAFAGVAAFSQTVLRDSRHAELMSLACKTAIVERDVAHLIFPDEVQTLPAAEGSRPGTPEGRLGSTAITPAESSLHDAVAHIASARRPVIVVGYGARDAMPAVVALAEHLHAPVLTTFKAKGQLADHHPLAAGVVGRSGTPVASWVMNESDLLVVFGASFSNHTGITPKRPIVQIDFDRAALGRFHAVAVPVWGEIGVTADRIRARLPSRFLGDDQRPQLAERWAIWRKEKARRRERDRGQGLNAALVFEALTHLAPADAVIAVDVGNNTYSFGRYFECKRQRVLMSGYLGSIGFALPAAMGAWAATQSVPAFADRKVISVSGDGGFGQYMGEFTTAVKYGMNITHVLLNNSELGKISKEQRTGQWPVWETELRNPSFAAYAGLCGGRGILVDAAHTLEEGLSDALAHDGPSLVEILTDAELV